MQFNRSEDANGRNKKQGPRQVTIDPEVDYKLAIKHEI
jgi:hypothetical protein